MWFLGMIYVKRSWTLDKNNIKKQLAGFSYSTKKCFPIWIVTFAEGSRITPSKLKEVSRVIEFSCCRLRSFAKRRAYLTFHHTRWFHAPRDFVLFSTNFANPLKLNLSMTLRLPIGIQFMDGGFHPP